MLTRSHNHNPLLTCTFNDITPMSALSFHKFPCGIRCFGRYHTASCIITRYQTASQGITQYRTVSHSITRYHMASQGITQCPKVSQGITQHHKHFLYNFTLDNSNQEHELFCHQPVIVLSVHFTAPGLLPYCIFTIRYVPIYTVIQRCIVLFSLDFSIPALNLI